MILIHRNLRAYLLVCFIGIGSLFSTSSLAQPCDTDLSPGSSCSDLRLSGSALHVLIPSEVRISGDIDALSVQSTSSNSSVTNYGSLDSLSNGGNRAVYSEGLNFTLMNYGTVQGYTGGIRNLTEASMIQIVNAGTITSFYGNAIDNDGLIGSIHNLNTISAGGGGDGIFNSGIITTLNNSGMISAGNSMSGVANATLGSITALNNSGSISAGTGGSGISNAGSVDSLINARTGSISSDDYGYGILNTKTITTLNNLGLISLRDYGYGGIFNNSASTIHTLNNSGEISVGLYSTGIKNEGPNVSGEEGMIFALNNSGKISVGDGGVGVVNYGTITSLTNTKAGRIEAGDNYSSTGISNAGTIGALYNFGVISVGHSIGAGIGNSGRVSLLQNSGDISIGDGGSGIYNSREIETFANSGSITGGHDSSGVYNDGVITAFTNSGTIAVGNSTYAAVYNQGTIVTLTNLGTISVGAPGFGVSNNNSGTIVTLNNAQGGDGLSAATTALSYQGTLPANYNIIINSSSHYGQLDVWYPGGRILNFGIYGAPLITSRTYTGVLSGTVRPRDTYAGAYDNMTWSLVENAGAYDLEFVGISLMGTQQSLARTASLLRGAFTSQSSAVVNGLNYDCRLFDVNNVCLSTGGRHSYSHGAPGHSSSALLIGAYRLNKNIRLGAWVDQSLLASSVTGVRLSNSKPLFGVFGAWAESPSGEGYEVKVSAAYGDRDISVTRDVVGLSEPGSGSSRLNTQAISTVSSYGFRLNKDVLVSPYVGVQHSRAALAAYAERAASDVTAPLSYGRLSQENFSLLVGLRLLTRLDPKTSLFGSVGVEQDVKHRGGQYSATGINGLAAINFNPSVQRARSTASAGLSYDIDKKQRVTLSGVYREEAFHPTASTSVFAIYTVGF